MSITRHEIFDADMCRKQNDFGGAAIDVLRYVDVKMLSEKIIPDLETIIEKMPEEYRVGRIKSLESAIVLLKDVVAYVGPPKD